MRSRRILPRYTTSHLGIKVIFPSLHGAQFYLENVSLSGIQIFGKSKIITQDYNQVIIQLSDKEKFKTNIHQVWFEEDLDKNLFKNNPLIQNFSSNIFRSGMKLKFIEENNYQKWLKFITAIHTINAKKR